MRIGQFDTKTTYPEEQSRLISLALETYLDTELYQVNGLVLIMDFQETTMAHFGIWTFPKLKVIINAMNEIVTFRIKEIHIVQLPKYGAILADFAIAGLSEKLRRRIKFHKTLDGLKGSIDESVLPTIYGGKQTLEDANKEFLRRTFQERNRLLKQTEMYIDLSIPSPNAQSKSNSGLQREFAEESVIGSFRQLNVD
ncbi:retinaldehyde-binding protein 1-like [Sabethes cyaneus]|uniref:retinaldehyde-binding protein 1-like n=1 Tax=Sabethes cyaneus TaxID=53552 RepID=UPI00237E733F|nr:retinaldehyde-binding protein 1-like [Sabethes cyaneus]